MAWENLWIVYSVVGLLIIPVFVAGISVPNLISVYRLSSAESIIAAALLGCAWGLANVLFGFAVSLAGMSISFSIVCRLSASLGALLPLVLLTPGRLMEPFGFSICIGVLLALGGVFIIGAAGRRKETLRLVQKLRSPQQRR